jgi:uncharacterized protein YaaR (DUF327 family)
MEVVSKFKTFGEMIKPTVKTKLEKAKKIVVSYGEKNPSKMIVRRSDVIVYKCGSNPYIDSLLMDVWDKRKNDNLEKAIKQVEIALCRKRIEDLSEEIDRMKLEGRKENIKFYQELIKEYIERLMKISI